MLLMSNETDEGARLKGVILSGTKSSRVVSSVNDENEENEENERDGDNDGSSAHDVSGCLAPADSTESQSQSQSQSQSIVVSAARPVSSLNSCTANDGSEARLLVSSLTSCSDNDGSEARLVAAACAARRVSSVNSGTDNDGSEGRLLFSSLTSCTDNDGREARLLSTLACCVNGDFFARLAALFVWSRSE
jgi:hypothetical protein